MLILLSSGARTRYRDDIVRAVALPAGTDLQFRYETALIENEVLDDVKQGRLVNANCVVCYVDTTNAGGTVPLVPCRFAKIRSAELAGSSCILRFRVGDFPDAEVSDGLRQALVDGGRPFPHWEFSRGKHDLLGKFFFKSSATGNALLETATAGLHGFEGVVERLLAFGKFNEEEAGTFFHVESVRRRGASKVVDPTDGGYAIVSGAEVDVRVYCFRPAGDVEATLTPCNINVSCVNDSVTLPLGTTAEIDSEYDVKTFKLYTKSKAEAYNAPLRLYLTKIAGKDEPRMDIVLPFRFGGSKRLTLIRLAMVTIGLGAPSLIAAVNSGKEVHWWSVVLFLFFAVIGACGAIFETFGFKK